MRKIFLLTLFAFAVQCMFHQRLPAVVGDKPVSPANVIPAGIGRGADVSEKLTRMNFEETLLDLYKQSDLAAYGLGYDVFRLGMVGYFSLKNEGALNDKGMVTIIDFSKPGTEKRFYTIDIDGKKVKYHTYVAHGRNTGENRATAFSNIPHSNQSSLGFYVTGETYFGSKGFSLRLDGMEKSFNDRIRSRAVVIHAARYVTEDWISRYGRLGRSQGCPALPPALNKEVINTIKDGTAIFTYYPDKQYLNSSRYLKIETLFEKLDSDPIELAGLPGEGRS